MKYTLCVPCLFGIEGIVADELRAMEMEDVRAENGRVIFCGDERDIIRLSSFPARSFDELFEGVKSIDFENYIGKYEAFPVKGHSLSSKLTSIPD